AENRRTASSCLLTRYAWTSSCISDADWWLTDRPAQPHDLPRRQALAAGQDPQPHLAAADAEADAQAEPDGAPAAGCALDRPEIPANGAALAVGRADGHGCGLTDARCGFAAVVARDRR